MMWWQDGEESGGDSAGERPVWERAGFAPDETQLGVLTSGAKRVAVCCTRQWGKTSIAALKALETAAAAGERLVVVVSPTLRQSGLLVQQVEKFARALGEEAGGDGWNPRSVRLSNGSRVVGLPGKEATIRGFAAPSLVVVDEAARVDDALYEAVRPMLAASEEGALWLLSTPWRREGFFWRVWEGEGGGEEWNRVRVTAEECPRIPAEFLEKEKGSLGERVFRREYGCEFREEESALFPEWLLEEAWNRE